MMIRHKIRNPNKPINSLHNGFKVEDYGQDYEPYFYIFLSMSIILLLVIILTSIVLCYKIRTKQEPTQQRKTRRLSTLPGSASEGGTGGTLRNLWWTCHK